ncbi:hypothetical protein [Peloplasma aerotolerans]|uniref:Uncharacterized protein n=1 Tax=Peloplasma aerotolerans TaxID=3044389 RepID=A0AAW6UCN3_9MOLU|nr:hypothetical protein [Mariniplasma sp. M4Ah]MDI6453256.1 hypothetical protein [Mariniplasma sp. M4Ah]
MKDKIIKALNYFQDAYIKKDPSLIDDFMKLLFIKDNLIVFGTGINEICLTDEQSRELFISDWKYWGDYRLNFDTVDIKQYPSFTYVNIEGALTYQFKDDDETYAKFAGYVRENMESGRTYDFMDVQHYLSHLLHARDQKQRSVIFPIMTSFVFVEHDNRAKIKRIMFSMMNNSLYKDIRFEDVLPYKKAFLNDIDKIKALGHKQDISISELKFSDDSFIINHKGTKFDKNKDDDISSCFNHDLNLKIPDESVTLLKTSKHAFFTIYATLEKQTTKEDMEKDLKNHILKTLETSIPDKEKLFMVRRDIALTYKEMSLGFTFTWPIRLHGVIEKKQNTWSIKHLNITDPFNIILEGK